MEQFPDLCPRSENKCHPRKGDHQEGKIHLTANQQTGRTYEQLPNKFDQHQVFPLYQLLYIQSADSLWMQCTNLQKIRLP